VAANQHREQKRHWQRFVKPFIGVDPMLTTIPTDERIKLLSTFAERVRNGDCGNGNRVQASTDQVALCAIGKTFEMDGRANPTYRSEGKYWLPSEQQIEGYRRQDPPAQHKLAVPVSLIKYLVKLGKNSPSGKVCTIAFYYLLRVREYTGHCKLDRCRYTAAKAAMHITNQKNGTRGSIISHDTSNTKACPVRALTRRVSSIIQHPQCTPNDIISTYYSSISHRPHPLQASDVNTMVKTAV
jgi:hypothetical protein